MNTSDNINSNQDQSKTKGFGSIPVNLLRNLTLVTTITLLALSTLSGSFNAHARQQEQVNIEVFNNPQAILNVSFKDNVYLDNIIDNELNSDKNWQGLKFDSNTVGITNLTGLSNIGGIEEMVTINGKYTPRSLNKSYKDKLQELIVKIDDLKSSNETISNNDISKEVNQELSKMDSWEVKKQRYFNFSQSKILNVSLLGNANTLAIIKIILDKSGHAKSINYTVTSELQAKIEEVKRKIDDKLKSNNLPTQDILKVKGEQLSEEQKNKTLSIINSSAQELINTELSKTEEGKRQLQQTITNQELIKTGKVNLDDKDYQSIDKLLTTDEEGNKVIDNTLTSNLKKNNYTNQEISIIKDLIKSYNDMPEYQKSNIQSSIQELEEEQGTVQSPITKAGTLLTQMVGGIKAEAKHYFHGNGWESKNEWWRMGIRLPGSFIEDLEWVVGNWGGMNVAGYAANRINSKVATNLCTKIAPLCATIGVIISVYYLIITYVNRFNCRKDGVWIYKNHIFPPINSAVIIGGTPYVNCY